MATSEIADTVRSLTDEAAVVASEVRTGVEQSSAATSGFASINDSIDQLEGIVDSVGRAACDPAAPACRPGVGTDEPERRSTNRSAGDGHSSRGRSAPP